MAGRPLRRLQAQTLAPFADWVPPKPRYVKPTASGMASVSEAPHPAFRSKKHGVVVVWDGIDDYGDSIEYEPNAVAVREGGEYLFSGLQGLAAFHDEDSRKPYSVILPAGATYAEALSYILSALDKYPTAAQMPPALFEGLYKSKGSSYGRITMKWGMAPSQWLRPREQRKKNPGPDLVDWAILGILDAEGPLTVDEIVYYSALLSRLDVLKGLQRLVQSGEVGQTGRKYYKA